MKKRIFCILVAAFLAFCGVTTFALEQKTPASLITTYADSPKTSRSFTWYTDTDISETVIQFVQEEYYTENYFDSENIDEIYGTSHILQTSENGEARNIHKVNLAGLKPGTKYYYRIGGNGYWSDVFSFITEGESEESFTFFNMTDTQASSKTNFSAYKNYVNVLNDAITRFPDGAFVLHTGDVIINNSIEHYDKIYELTQGFFSSIPLMLAPGNHELGKDSLGYVSGINNINSHYQFPTNGPDGNFGTVYSFDYGNAHFVILDSQNTVSMSEQIKWLKNDIASTDKTWKIVSLHVGPYNNYGKGSTSIINAMDELGIDLVLFGHNHAFLRSNPIRKGITDASNVRNSFYSYEGTVYYSSGCAGSNSGRGGSSDSSATSPDKMAGTWFSVMDYDAPSSPLYGAITVTKSTLIVQTFALSNMQIVDEFTINKFAFGDVNSDGKVNTIDANLVRKFAVKLENLDEAQQKIADVNGDGKVNVIDASLIRKFVAKLIDSFPIENT